MRQKELRIALVCYGGISLAVYMHGVTKEVWKLARASRAVQDALPLTGVEAVYADLLRDIAARSGLLLRMFTDIIAGASAGGINGVFLAQAIHGGLSLDPVTDLWLNRADIDVLLDPDARLFSRFFKFWAVPIVRIALSRPGGQIAASVAREARGEVRAKLSRLVRSRWFEAPFGGIGFSRLLAEALDAMAKAPHEAPLVPAGHPLDLFVTATDFHGHAEILRLHSPAEVVESEHRLPISFRKAVPAKGGVAFAETVELVLAARATASFPGAFPPLAIAEIDALAHERGDGWPGRDAFLARVLPHRKNPAEIAATALIDGSVLVNAPFAEAMAALPARPAEREVDRRLVYIEPTPRPTAESNMRPPGFLSVIFGSVSTIPREQPIRDNLEALARQSREMAAMREVLAGLRPEVEAAVERLFGYTLFLDSPTPSRLVRWQAKAEGAATKQAGYTYAAYAEVRIGRVLDTLARLVADVVPGADVARFRARFASVMAQGGPPLTPVGRLRPTTSGFLQQHDLAQRVQRVRLLVRRLTSEWEGLPGVTLAARDAARDAAYRALALYFDCEAAGRSPAVAAAAHRWNEAPDEVLAAIAAGRALARADSAAIAILADALVAAPKALRRMMLLTFLGFAFYDVATLPMLRGADVTEFEPAKVDRISPEDAASIRKGGAAACLRGVEFHCFGAFFSRAYRENDYLWGRLHGAERMIDLVASAAEGALDAETIARFKREAFLAILDEEQARLTTDPTLVAGIRAEVLANVGG